MNLWLAGLAIAMTTTASVSTMYFVRRMAPAGGYFNDSDRSAGVFGVLGSAFAVVLAFVMFLAFESYGNAKAEAGREAIAVMELYNTASIFPSADQDALRSRIICYSRSVVSDEWRAMRDDRQSLSTQGWVDDLEATATRLDVANEKASVAFGHWLSTDAARQEGRRGRLAEATPVVPMPLWVFVILGGIATVVFVASYADSAERFAVQALMIGSVAAMVTASLLVVNFLDHPYENQVGSIKPKEMIRSVALMENKAKVSGLESLPCDLRGNPVSPGGRPSA